MDTKLLIVVQSDWAKAIKKYNNDTGETITCEVQVSQQDVDNWIKEYNQSKRQCLFWKRIESNIRPLLFLVDAFSGIAIDLRYDLVTKPLDSLRLVLEELKTLLGLPINERIELLSETLAKSLGIVGLLIQFLAEVTRNASGKFILSCWGMCPNVLIDIDTQHCYRVLGSELTALRLVGLRSRYPRFMMTAASNSTAGTPVKVDELGSSIQGQHSQT
jgi:hypothetical protein